MPFVIAAVAVCLYAALLRRLADLAAPLRLRLASLGEQTIAMDIEEEDRLAITLMLDHAFNPMATVVVAIATILSVFPALFTSRHRPTRIAPEVRLNRGKLLTYFLISIGAANPLFGVIVVAEMLILFITLGLISGQSYVVRTALSLARMEARALSALSSFGWRNRSA